MIICFTGTGNTRYVADRLQEHLGDDITRLAPGLMREPEKVNLPVTDGRVIWMFPVHCWGIAVRAEVAMQRMQLQSDTPLVHHMVCTCGDDVGLTEQQWREVMRKRGWRDGNAYSVQMPNNFTFMRGFDVDPPELVAKKMAAVAARVEVIAKDIRSKLDSVSDVEPGRFPWFKSRVIRPWFNKHKMKISKFRYTADCSGCGRCMRNCPFGTISVVDGHPHWDGICTFCLRCYHCCPHHAIDYDGATKGKGQYICEGYSIKP